MRKTESQMLRKIVGISRYPCEDYVTWVKRATRRARALASEANIKPWLQRQRKSKWDWAGHVARKSVSDWVWRVTFWRDREWTDDVGGDCFRPMRRRAGRWSRWEDEVQKYAASIGWSRWSEAARDRDAWKCVADSF